jgi:tripartite-type tricarboxylate transporter receptor subunit TctC
MEERFNAIPDVPTMKEENLPGVMGLTWFAIFAPAATPSHIVSKLNAVIDTFLRKDETIKKYEKLGFRILGGSPKRLAKQIEDDRAKWAEVIEKAHLGQND